MTFDEWLTNHKVLDAESLVWKETDKGRQEVDKVHTRSSGLKKTTMGPKEVSWFVREMSMPGSYIRKLFDDACNNDTT
ncbi:hypothetical protein EJ02DRAFT_449908 [Clathrospora elynae]|uniref:Uncharacterized protein n=1 Tax=Clathrospora elynae TaxID=706981 RepID=A0A6A5T409_9PLEO|nr:hypothetical protein EJ02DRAFT_449908 [Clathrospora elynae]